MLPDKLRLDLALDFSQDLDVDMNILLMLRSVHRPAVDKAQLCISCSGFGLSGVRGIEVRASTQSCEGSIFKVVGCRRLGLVKHCNWHPP